MATPLTRQWQIDGAGVAAGGEALAGVDLVHCECASKPARPCNRDLGAHAAACAGVVAVTA
jgi:hypothetical protein